MTKKGSIQQSELKKILDSHEDGNLLSLEKTALETIPQNKLAQLLINTLANSQSDRMSYNNVTGKLLCYMPASIKKRNGVVESLDCVNFSIDKDMRLGMGACKMTSISKSKFMDFGKMKLADYPRYEFSLVNHTLKRASKDKFNDPASLIQKPTKNNRAKVTFFETSSFEKFLKTKIGMTYELIKLIEKKLGQYMTVSLKKYRADQVLEHNQEMLKSYKDAVQNYVNENGISLVDEIKEENSRYALENVALRLQSYFENADISISEQLEKNKLNIRYVHEPEYYKKFKLKDPHADELTGFLVQHFTQEKNAADSQVAILNLVKELSIKADLSLRKLTMADWGSFGLSGKWSFFYYQNEHFYKMEIHPDGSFEITSQTYGEIDPCRFAAHLEAFQFNDKSKKCREGLVGLVEDGDGNLNMITDTGLFSLPNFMEVGDLLKGVAQNHVFEHDEFQAFLEAAKKRTRNKKVLEELDEVISRIDCNEVYDKTKILSMFVPKGGAKKALVNQVFENTGIMLKAYIRGESARNMYMSGNVDINYILQGENKAMYCVGEIGAGMKDVLEKTCSFKEVSVVGESKLIFDQILKLMAVGFVKFGMLTVIPFPFKYLREYASAER